MMSIVINGGDMSGDYLVFWEGKRLIE